MDLLMDTLICVSGGYLIYLAVIMKRDGKIPPSMMANKNQDFTGADVAGFIKYMYGKTVVIGACAMLSGIIGVINDVYGGLGVIQLILTVVFFVVIILYGYITVKAQKKYLGI